MAGMPLRLVIQGRNLPGTTFRYAGVPIHGVHVGVQVGRNPTDLVPGDAASATWSVDVRVTPGDGSFDLHGPAVHGRRGERFVYLTWGDVTVASGFTMFRRAKLMLDTIEPSLLQAAIAEGRAVCTTVDLTDGYGGPRCGRVVPAWSLS